MLTRKWMTNSFIGQVGDVTNHKQDFEKLHVLRSLNPLSLISSDRGNKKRRGGKWMIRNQDFVLFEGAKGNIEALGRNQEQNRQIIPSKWNTNEIPKKKVLVLLKIRMRAKRRDS